jgi:hypothetical protein
MLLKTTRVSRNASVSTTFEKRTLTRWNPVKTPCSELTRLISVIKSKRDRALYLLACPSGLLRTGSENASHLGH